MIIVKGLVKNYDTVKAVQSIEFTINHGEVVGFLGANGAGKSTTLKILTGYLTPTSGDVSIDGLNINYDSHEIKKIVGYLPESNPLYMEMFVYDLLKFTANTRGIFGTDFKSALDRVVEQCGLKEVVHKKVGECSKGYKQRVGLACAMIHDPKILILDEPVTGLDPNQIIEIRKLIKKLGKEKLVLMSSHILQEIEATVDRIIIIDKGKIVADGTTKKLMNEFMGNIELTLEVIGLTDAKIVKMKNEFSKIKITKLRGNHKAVLSYKKKNDPREKVFDFIVKNKLSLLQMSTKTANLEDIFRKLTN
jgi:ABC-2 type transport system ATP-binding protein